MSTSIGASVTGRVGASVVAVGLARAARKVVDEQCDSAVQLAVRLGIDQLFRRESATRRASLLLAADALAALRDPGAETERERALYDLVEVACLLAAREAARAQQRLCVCARATFGSDDALVEVRQELETVLLGARSETQAAAGFSERTLCVA